MDRYSSLQKRRLLLTRQLRVRKKRLAPPPGYEKVKLTEGTFGYFLRHLPLKPVGSDLHYYNGSIKQKNYTGAVVDIDFGHGGGRTVC